MRRDFWTGSPYSTPARTRPMETSIGPCHCAHIFFGTCCGSPPLDCQDRLCELRLPSPGGDGFGGRSMNGRPDIHGHRSRNRPERRGGPKLVSQPALRVPARSGGTRPDRGTLVAAADYPIYRRARRRPASVASSSAFHCDDRERLESELGLAQRTTESTREVPASRYLRPMVRPSSVHAHRST